MSKIVSEIVKGRKTFFIAPDDSFISEYFFQEYLYKDYECYFIYIDSRQTLERKVDSIISVFDDAIIFFNIDSPVKDIDWPSYIRKLNNAHPDVVIGVTYNKRNSMAEIVTTERKYLYDIGIKGGCIQLEYQQNSNFVKIEKVLRANQAMGRRHTIRAFCYQSCTFSFEDKKKGTVTRIIEELSVSHFAFTVPKRENTDLGFKEYEKIEKATFLIRGVRFVCDCILYLKRETPEGILYVFAFYCNDKIGLDQMKKKIVIRKMYEIMTERCLSLVDENEDFGEELKIIKRKKSVLDEIEFDDTVSEQIIK